jgi:hypothetical protein
MPKPPIITEPTVTEWIGYFYIEDLGLTDTQRQTLIDVLKAWGLRNDSPYPNLRNHWAVRPDGLAMIFEGALDAEKLTVLWFRTKLSEIFSVALDTITATTTSTVYGPVATFKYLSVNKLRMGIFGGLTATWYESWLAATQFLADNQDTWGTELTP